MTFQGTRPCKPSPVFESYYPSAIGKDDGLVEVDEMRIRGDAMGVMAGCAGGLFINDMQSVFFETLIRQDGGSIMALIAESIDCSALSRKIHCNELPL